MNFEQFLNERRGEYEVDVEIRDARAAGDIARDMFRGLYKTDGSNAFIFQDEETRDEFTAVLDKQGLSYDT